MLASAKAALLMPFLSILKIYVPPKRRCTLDGGTLSACPTAALWSFHTAAEALQRRRDKAQLSRCDRLAIGAAAAATPRQGEATL